MLVRVIGYFVGVTTADGKVEYPRAYRDGAAAAGGAFKFKIVNGLIKAADGVSPLYVLGATDGQPNPPALRLIAVPAAPGKPFDLTFTPIPNDPGNGSDAVNVNVPPANSRIVLPERVVRSLDQAAADARAGAAAALAAVTRADNAASGVYDAIDAAAFVLAMVPDAVNNANDAAYVARQAGELLPAHPVQNQTEREAYFSTHGDCEVIQIDTLDVWRQVGNVRQNMGPASKALGDGGVQFYDTVVAMRSTQGPKHGNIYRVSGRYVPFDGGAGFFWYDATSVANVDGIFAESHLSIPTGRFRRVWDGIIANFAWAGQAEGAASQDLTDAFNRFQGLIVSLDKTYLLNGEITLPNFTLYGKPGAGFRAAAKNTVRNMLRLSPGCHLDGVIVDGNFDTTRNKDYSTNALFRSYGNVASQVTLTDCVGLNAGDHVVFGISASGTEIRRIRINSSNNDAIYFQLSDALVIDGVFARKVQGDTVKVHSIDGSNPNFEIHTLTIRDIFTDYSDVTLALGNVLAVEVWGGQTGFIHNAVLENIQIKSPASMGAFGFWGISLDTCADTNVNFFTVDGDKRFTITIGIELAGTLNCSFSQGTVIGVKYVGCSMSQPNTRNSKLDNVTFRDFAQTTGQTYAIQWYNQISGGDVINCTFKDAGDRFLFFNNAGNGVRVQGNHFFIAAQNIIPYIIYVTGSVFGVKILDNEFGPTLWAGDVASGIAYARPGELANGTGFIIDGNTFNALRPDGGYGGGSLISYGSGGGHRFSNNIGFNFTAPYLGQFDAPGASCSFLDNLIYGSAAPAQYFRTTGANVDYVRTATATAAAASLLPYTTGLSGGTVNCVVYLRGNKAYDLHPGMRQKRRSMSALRFKAADGKYYKPGADVPLNVGFVAGQRVMLGSRLQGTDPNIFQANATDSISSSPTTPIQDMGFMLSDTLFHFNPSYPDEIVDKAVPVIENYLADPQGSFPARYTDLWLPLTGKDIRSTDTYTSQYIELHLSAYANNTGRHLVALNVSFFDGSALATVSLKSSSDKQLALNIRASGTTGHETSYAAQLDGQNGAFKLVRYLDGVATTLDGFGASLVEGVHYVIEIASYSTLIMCRYWIAGQARPDWQIVKIDSAILQNGRVGVGFRNGEVAIGSLSYVTGLAVLSDEVVFNV